MSAKICVAVRKRPLFGDNGGKERDVIDCHNQTVRVDEPKIKYDLTPYIDTHQFNFDYAFSDKDNNYAIYKSCTLPLIDTMFSGGNSTCFAYGQTGSGKTHTMLGKGDEPGLYACAARDVFTRAHKAKGEVYASFYEIYGRKLFDLLNDRARLYAREDADHVVNICGLTEHGVRDVDALLQMIANGSVHRAAGTTAANADSSRSHAVLQLEVRDSSSQKTVGKISFIDLAGNERGADTFDCDRKTRMEGAEINKSLLALKECIRALGMGKSHVPFRGSVLTEVLKDSFVGNCRTTMIATVSPGSSSCEHSLNTLRYTQRVKEFVGPKGGKRGDKVVDRKPAPTPVAGGGRKMNAKPKWNDEFNASPEERDALATIVESHLRDLDEQEAEILEESDEETVEEPSAAPAPAPGTAKPPIHKKPPSNVHGEMAAIHAHVVNKLRHEEEEITAQHRRHVETKMAFMRKEVQYIQALDDTSNLDEYVAKVDVLLAKQMREMEQMRETVKRIQSHLKEEEMLSRTLTPALKVRK